MIPILGAVEFWHWWALGGVLLIVEALVPGFVFLWLGVAASLVGDLVFLPATIALWRRYFPSQATLEAAARPTD